MLLGMEGFDHYATADQMYLRQGALQWNGPALASAFAPAVITPGRGGFGKSIGLASFNPFLFGPFVASFSVNEATLRIGFALRFAGGAASVSGASFSLSALDPIANVTQCSIELDAIGLIRAFNGAGTQIGISANNAFNSVAWSFLEVAFTIGTSGGAIEVQINGATVLAVGGVNTQASANATFGAVLFHYSSTTGFIEIDDFRYSDSATGPGLYACNSWLGDLRVATLPPIADAGVSWTPLSGANWQEVSELAFDGDASYNLLPTLGDEDRFSLAALTGTISYVIGVQVTGAFRQTDASLHTITQQIKSGGSEVTGPSHTLGLGYQFFTDLYPINPVSAASWTVADVNSLQIGYIGVT